MEEKSFANLTIFEDASENGVVTITFKGEMSSTNLTDLETYFESCDFKGVSEVILDFKDLTFMVSVSLGLMVRLHQRIDGLGGKMQIINTKPIIRKILRLTRLDQRLEIVDATE